MHLYSLLLQQSSSYYTTVLLALLVLCLLYVTYTIITSPLRKVPGPRWARLSRLWLLQQIRRGNIQQVQIDLHKEHGPVVRIAPNQYSLNDLECTRTIYAHGGKYTKSDFYYPFGKHEAGHGNLFNEQDEKLHGAKRKRVASLYALTSLLSYEDFVDQSNSTFVSKLTQMANQKKAFAATQWMQYYAFDVIGAITVGSPFGFLEHGHDFQGILTEIKASQIYGSQIGTLAPWLHPLIVSTSRLLGLTNPLIATESYVNRNISYKRNQIEKGQTTEEHSGKQDFLEKLFALKDKGKVDDLDIEVTIANNVVAGSDTTAVSLSSIIYHLIRNPSSMQKLRDEIARHKEAGRISSPIKFKEAQELPYLQAVIKEGLRLHPAVGMSLPRVVPKGGATFAGYYFPAGTVIGVNPWVIHHNKDAFGHDADEFRPERWLESKERSVEMERYILTFGAGARTCIGKNISMLEINKLVPELVTKFDFELEEPDKDWKLRNIFFVLQEYKCYVKERKHDNIVHT